MNSVCLYFQVHQPRRLRKFQVFDIGEDVDYFSDYEDGVHYSNPAELQRVAKSAYLPTNKLLLKLLTQHPEFKISMSFTGVFLEQLEEHNPQLLESFQSLIDTGRVEILGETYYHSLASIYSEEEFIEQIKLHAKKVEEVFGVKPKVFRNTELIYNDDIAAIVQKLGFAGAIAEGADRVMEWRSPNFLYAAPSGLPLLVKNSKLSEDLTDRFASQNWKEYPLTADKYASWVAQADQDTKNQDKVINLFMDYEVFGHYHPEESGIFEFLSAVPKAMLGTESIKFVTPSQAAAELQPAGTLKVEHHTSWAHQTQDLSTWLHNEMQHSYGGKVFALRNRVLASQDEELISLWRHLQESTHFTQMATDWAYAEHKEKYFSHFDSPYVAFLSYMNMLQDLDYRLRQVESMQTESAVSTQIVVPNLEVIV